MSNATQPQAQLESNEIRAAVAELTTRLARVEERLGIAPPRPAPTPPIAPQPSTIVPMQPVAVHPVAPASPPPIAAVPAPTAPAEPVMVPPVFLPPVVAESAVTDVMPAAQAEASPERVADSWGGTEAPHAARDADDNSSILDEGALASEGPDWESLIGGKWALWIGSISMFLAIASFLAYTWRFLPPPPPGAKVGMGLAAGVAALIAGAFFQNRTQRWFSEGLFGSGLGTLYLSVWAAVQYFDLISFSTGFASLAFITAVGVFLAVRYDAVSLITLATIGGFLTPLLLHSDGKGGSVAPFLTYIAVLNAGILAVSLFKKWRGIAWLSAVATLLVVGGWSVDSYSSHDRWTVFSFYTLYFLLFLGTSCFYSLAHGEQTDAKDLMLFFATASVYALVGFEIINDALGAYPGIFPIALSLFYGLLGLAAKALAPDNQTLRYSAAGLSLCSLTIAVPIQLKQEWIAIGWNVEAVTLLLLSCRFRNVLLQRAGQIVWGLSLCALLFSRPESPLVRRVLFINEAALPLLIFIASAALVTARLIVARKSSDDWKDELDAYYATSAVLGGAWLLAQELRVALNLWHPAPASTWQQQGAFLVTCLWSVYAVAAFAVGLRYRHLAVRTSALCVALVAATLPLWFGTTQLHLDFAPFWNVRWLSYLASCVALAAIWWMLSREQDASTPQEADSLWGPIATMLLLLAGLTTEVYCSFRHLPGNWQASALFAIAMLWCVYAFISLLLGCAWRQPTLRYWTYAIGGVGVALLLTNSGNKPPEVAPWFNLSSLSFTVITVTMMAAAMVLGRQESRSSEEEDVLTGIRFMATLVGVWGLTQETYETCRYFKHELGSNWQLFAGFVISILWHTIAATLWRIGLKFEKFEHRGSAIAVGILGSGLLLCCSCEAWRLDWLPVFNVRFVAFVAAATLLATTAMAMRRHANRIGAMERSWALSIGLTAAALLLWGLTQEAHEISYYTRHLLGPNWDLRAQMSISVVWSLYGALLLIAGINRHNQPVRLAGLGLLGLTVLKVFLFDLGFLDTPLRIVSFGGLGAALIFISWLYSRFGVEHRTTTTTGS